MKKKILFTLLIIGSAIGFAQEDKKVDSKSVRIFNSSPLFLMVGEEPTESKVISQDAYKDFDCFRNLNVYLSSDYDSKAVWSLKADAKNCGNEMIVTRSDVMH